jgi:hypothetical protein
MSVRASWPSFWHQNRTISFAYLLITTMKTRSLIKRSVIYAFVAATAGLLLAGCATPGPDTADGCVGPASFCNIYFGS